MRTIKFRAWDNEHGKMITAFDINGDINHRAWLNDVGFLVHYHQCELMQFTGLLDKNGKEIYEGDIVKGYGCDIDEIGQVVFGKYVTNNDDNEDIMAWCFSCPIRYHALDPQSNWEVIGNIYENPELLTSN